MRTWLWRAWKRFPIFATLLLAGAASPDTARRPPWGATWDGDPVGLATGLYNYEHSDLYLKDVLPIELRRTYRNEDRQSRAFGIGTNHPYDIFLVGDTKRFAWIDLILADGGRVRYTRVSVGTGYVDAVLEHTATPSQFYRSTLRWNPAWKGWDLLCRDGARYQFPSSYRAERSSQGALVGYRDSGGRSLQLTREPNGRLTRIVSPNGRRLDLVYDDAHRIIRASDDTGQVVQYAYDPAGRLVSVTDAQDQVTEYTYDSLHRMLTIKKSGRLELVNEYDMAGRAVKQTLADGGVFKFAYTLNQAGKILQTDVTDPRGRVRVVTFNDAGYIVRERRNAGTTAEEAVTYSRDAASNRIQSTTTRRPEHNIVAVQKGKPAGPPGDGVELLRKATRAFENLKSYLFEGVMAVETKAEGISQKFEAPILLAASGPERIRTQIRHPTNGMLRVRNGETTWEYLPQYWQYSRRLSSPLESGREDWTGPLDPPVFHYARLLDGLKQARVLREETIEVNGKRADCYVVEAAYASAPILGGELESSVFWIEKARHLLLRESFRGRDASDPNNTIESTIRGTLTRALANEPLPESLFTFVPPVGAEEVGALGLTKPAGRDWIGQEAPAFALRDLGGVGRNSEDLAGRVVLLAFWAGASAPSREHMALLEKLHREFMYRGLFVVAVNSGEHAEAAREYVASNGYTMSVLLDSDREVTRLYRVSALPAVVVINRAGRVVDYQTGFGNCSDQELRDALKRADME